MRFGFGPIKLVDLVAGPVVVRETDRDPIRDDNLWVWTAF